MLTCVNPDVTYQMKAGNTTVRHNGVAVALKWLLSLVRKCGGTPPPEERICQEIRTLEIGDIRDRKQHFNKYLNE